MTDKSNSPIFGRRGKGAAEHEFAMPPERPADQIQSEFPDHTVSSPPPRSDNTIYTDVPDDHDAVAAGEYDQPPIVTSSGASGPADMALPPPLRSASAKGTMVRFFNFLITLAVFGVFIFAASVWYGKTQFEARGPLQEEATYVVAKGATFNSIIPDLEAKNIIQKQGPLRIFSQGVKTAGKSGALKAGEFAFKPGMSMREVMLHLTEGRSIQYTLGFPEGWTSYKMMERIAADETLVGPIPPIPAEGTMLPNTYSFQRGMTRGAFVQLLKDSQQKAVRDIWNSRVDGLPLKSAEEMVILASIVEKETGVASERPRVASVFINRLRKGMRLQTDPTVIYGIWGGKGKPKDRGGLRRSELDKPTEYNTYQIDGLPPGPIANPGLEAMRAVVNPDQTDFLYFVADGTGGHVFSKTLKEHNANVKKWRAIEAKRKKDAEEASSN